MAKKIHQGKLLKELVDWSGLSQEQFGNRVHKSRVWVYSSFADERLMNGNLVTISKEFEVPMSFWEGKYKLPMEKKTIVSDSGDSEYKTAVQEKDRIISELRKELLESKNEIISLQKKLLEYHIVSVKES